MMGSDRTAADPLVLHIQYVPENALINTILNTPHVVFGAGPILGHLTAVQCGGGAADSEETDPATDTGGGGGAGDRKPQ